MAFPECVWVETLSLCQSPPRGPRFTLITSYGPHLQTVTLEVEVSTYGGDTIQSVARTSHLPQKLTLSGSQT